MAVLTINIVLLKSTVYRMRIFISIIVSCIVVSACTIKGSGTWKDENIDHLTRSEIGNFNEQLFKAIRNKDVKTLKSFMSDKLIEVDGNNLEVIANDISSAISKEYHVMYEFYVKNTSIGTTNVLPAGNADDNNFIIRYQALNEEMYVSLLLTGEILVTVIYGKYGNDWKINIIQFGQYSLFNLTAPDYYKQAKASYDQAHLIDAINLMGLSMRCLSPGNKFFEYEKSSEITAFYNTVLDEVKSRYSFPLVLSIVPTQPQIFRVSLEMTSEGFFPIIYYLSNVDLEDTSSLTAENEKIKDVIGQIFPGVDQKKKYVFYRAFNEIPDGIREIKHYGFIDKQAE